MNMHSHSGNVFSREGIGGIADKKARFTDGTVNTQKVND